MSKLLAAATIINYATVAGVITGDGVYNNGELVTLSATTNEGYKFLHWREGGGYS